MVSICLLMTVFLLNSSFYFAWILFLCLIISLWHPPIAFSKTCTSQKTCNLQFTPFEKVNNNDGIVDKLNIMFKKVWCFVYVMRNFNSRFIGTNTLIVLSNSSLYKTYILYKFCSLSLKTFVGRVTVISYRLHSKVKNSAVLKMAVWELLNMSYCSPTREICPAICTYSKDVFCLVSDRNVLYMCQWTISNSI